MSLDVEVLKTPIKLITGPDGAVAMSSANGLEGTGFTSQYCIHMHIDPLQSVFITL